MAARSSRVRATSSNSGVTARALSIKLPSASAQGLDPRHPDLGGKRAVISAETAGRQTNRAGSASPRK